jgi:hypothetical protein
MKYKGYFTIACLIPFLSGSFASSAASQEAELVNGASVGMSYSEARQRMRAVGFRGALSSRQISSCNVPAQHYPCTSYRGEFIDCTENTGLLQCRFALRDTRRRTMIIETRGEELIVSLIYAK